MSPPLLGRRSRSSNSIAGIYGCRSRSSPASRYSISPFCCMKSCIARFCRHQTTALIGGPWIAFKLYVVPVFFVFPIAFALNRLGQHYHINPDDAAQWSTLVKGSWFWDPIFLFSNYHLEHHYFPGVPFYNLPRLQ